MLYTGAMEKGQMHGKGSLIYANNDKYEGDFEYGARRPGARRENACACLPITNPDRRAAAGKRHGFGVYSYADGGTFEGEWIDDKVHGRGVSKYASGNRRDAAHTGWTAAGCAWRSAGPLLAPLNSHARSVDPRPAAHLRRLVVSSVQFCCARRVVARRVLTSHPHPPTPALPRYEGEWVDGKINRQGTLWYADGDRYQGEWREGAGGERFGGRVRGVGRGGERLARRG